MRLRRCRVARASTRLRAKNLAMHLPPHDKRLKLRVWMLVFAACGSDIPVLRQDGSRSQISHQGFGLAEIPVARLASAHYL